MTKHKPCKHGGSGTECVICFPHPSVQKAMDRFHTALSAATKWWVAWVDADGKPQKAGPMRLQQTLLTAPEDSHLAVHDDKDVIDLVVAAYLRGRVDGLARIVQATIEAEGSKP